MFSSNVKYASHSIKTLSASTCNVK